MSGDTVVVRPLDQGLLVAMVDVLGHGPEAHALASVIDEFLARFGNDDVPNVMKSLHQHLQGSRGAVAGICAIESTTGRLVFAGVGNTSMRRFGSTETRLVSQAGVLGQNMRTLVPQTLQLEPGDVVVQYTDGVSDRFTTEDYPGVLHHAPQQVADNIVQRFGKGHDDAACVAVRYGA